MEPLSPGLRGPEFLGPGDPAPVELVNRDGRSSVLLVCDHASRTIPRRLGDLGLSEADLDRHIAWDIGAEAAARTLSMLLDAPLLLARYSRLVVDCNRQLDDPTAFAQVSDGTQIPGNRGLSAGERAERAAAIHQPYHAAIASLRTEIGRRGTLPAILSIHSFSPVINGQARPWEIGLLWNRDGRIAEPLLESLQADGVVVGDNEPYSGRDGHGYTMHVHAEPDSLPHVLLEFRQDLIADSVGADLWARRVGAAATPILQRLGRLR